jgi:beta-glucosidase
MTLSEKLHFLILGTRSPRVENANVGVPRLCIPPLTLQDGPAGVAFGDGGVTQLPAPLALAATFDRGLAIAYGRVEGAEARTKGIDVLQGPDLNLDRVPTSGRGWETFGEDPFLAGSLGAAVTDGIQSKGVMAEVKHFPTYNQETARMALDQRVSERALEELYFRPFQMAVTGAHPAALMCEYGSVNGVNACQNPALYRALAAWGFTGFVRSDFRAADHPVAAIRAGLSLLKPGSYADLRGAVLDGHLPRAVVDRAVERVLAAMFAFGLIAHPRRPSPNATATSPAHAKVALEVAEHSIVLLKNRGGLLPLQGRGPRERTAPASIALIGPGAGPDATTAGLGSAYVRPGTHVSALTAIESTAAPGTVVRSVDTLSVPTTPMARSDFVAGSPLPPGPPVSTELAERGPGDFALAGIPPKDLTAGSPGSSAGWHEWAATVKVPVTGLYVISITSSGDTFMDIDGRQVFASRGLHLLSPWSFSVELRAGERHRLVLRWFSTKALPRPSLSWADETPSIEAAAASARAASVAVVFAGDRSSEGSDRPTLELPGAEDALISAVAAANRHTVVVLQTSGPVLMPWLSKVAGLLVSWYGGQEAGPAVSDVLFGRYDPSGHLPVTFPRTAAQGPTVTAGAYPGLDGTVTYSEGLDIGYRYYEAHREAPLFPFGFGLSYTHFAVSSLRVAPGPASGALHVSVSVHNMGRRAGRVVLQAYVSFPAGSGEPPRQLAAFASVLLRPGGTRRVSLELPRRAFEGFLRGRFVTVPGRYGVEVGQSSVALPLRASVLAPH